MKTAMYSLLPQAAAADYSHFVVVFLSDCHTHTLYYSYLTLLVS